MKLVCGLKISFQSNLLLVKYGYVEEIVHGCGVDGVVVGGFGL
jgi:hypothetical protein